MNETMRFWNHAAGEPWAITETALSTILTIAAREHELPQVLSARRGRDLINTQVTEERDGVAVIPVVGPLFRYANLFTAISGASSYEILAKDFTAALDNPDIRGIVLDIDSPGGEVNGCAEFANMIYEARGIKPILAYASGDAASGAYWIASACDQIVVSETSSLGSIGVVAVYRGGEAASDRVEIVSSQSPLKRLDPQSDEGRLRLQARIDAMAQVFIDTVARNRGVDPTKVVKDFGAGDVLVGRKAVQNGLADRTGSLEKTIADIPDSKPAGNPSPGPSRQPHTSTLQHEETVMDLETLQAEHPQLVAALIAQGVDQGRAQERERIGAIVGAESAQGREQLARHLAFATDMPAEMAVAALEAAPVQAAQAPETPTATSGFEQVMAAMGNPAIEPDGDDEEDALEDVAKRLAAYR
jgi:signal peptide peptidase SppA